MGEFFNDFSSGLGDPLVLALQAARGSTTTQNWNEDGSGIVSKIYGDGNTKTFIYGPRLKNLNVAWSNYGQTIPITFGVRRLNGMTIWSAPLTERTHKQTKTTISSATASAGATLDLPGLTGFPNSASDKTITHTYFYFATFAVAFGYGDPEATDKQIIQIRANGKLIYDAGSAHPEEALFEGIPRKLFPGLVFRFHPGTAAQDPDPTIQDYENRKYEIENSLAAGTGPNVVPGYHNMMYVVFDNFPLAQFGNALPDIQVTLADVTSRTILNDTYAGAEALSGSTNRQGIGMDWPSATLFSAFDGHLLTVDISSQEMVSSVVPDREYKRYAYSPTTGKLYATAVDALDPSTGVVLSGTSVWEVDPATGYGTQVNTLTASTGLGPYTQEGFVQPLRLIATPVLTDGGTVVDRLYLITGDGGATLFDVSLNNQVIDFGDIQADIIPGELARLPVFYYDYDNVVHKYVGSATAGGALSGFSILYTPPTGWYNRGMILSEKDLRLFILLVDAPLFATEGRLVCIDCRNGHTYWDVRGLPVWSIFLPTYESYIYAADTLGDSIAVPNSSRILTFRISDGTILHNAAAVAVDPKYTAGSGDFKAVFGPKNPYFYDIPSVPRTTLGAFILFAAAQARLVTSGPSRQIQVDASLDLIAIDGAYLDQVNLSFRELLKNLKLAFQFDVIESETLIKCVKRAENAAPDDFALTSENLLLTTESEDAVLPIQREADDNIPRKISYGFLDFQRDFEQNVVYAERVSFPDPTNFSTSSLSISVPIIMRLNEAEQWAYKVLYRLWSARNGYSFRVPPRQIYMEPGDAGTVTNQARVFAVKVDRVTYNDDFSMTVVASSFLTDYPISVVAQDPRWETPTLQFQSQTIAYIFDIPDPFPEDTDFALADGQRAKVIVQAGPQLLHRVWPGGYIQFLTDNGIYSTLFTVVDDQLQTGSVVTPLVDKTATVFSIDYDSAMEVQLANTSQSYATLSDLDFLNTQQNTLLVGDELVRFKTATDLGSGLWRLETFARGLRGTDQEAVGHGVGERVYLLTPFNHFTQKFDAADEGSRLNYRTSSVGPLEAWNARYTSIELAGRSNLPFSPVAVHATDDGADNLVLSWQRRSRAPGTDLLPDGEAEVVLGDWETAIEFRVDLYSDNTFSSLLGSISDDRTEGLSSSTSTATLDATARTSALGSSTMPTVLYAEVIQISPQWGDGVARRVTLYVE